MWVLKEPIENEKEIRRAAFKTATVFAALFSLIHFISVKLGWRYSLATIDPISWNEAFPRIPGILIIVGGSSFCLVYLFQKAKESYSRRQILICLKCEESTKLKGDEAICDRCGEKLLDLNQVKWVDEQTEKKVALK